MDDLRERPRLSSTRDRRHPRPAPTERRQLPGTARFVDPHTLSVVLDGGASSTSRAENDRDRGRDAAGATDDVRVRRPHDHGLGRAPRSTAPRVAGRRRRRRDRPRVRVDVRARSATKVTVVDQRAAHARVLRRRDRRGAAATTCATSASSSASARRSSAVERHDGARVTRLASGKRIVAETRALLGRPPGRHGRRSTSKRPA